MWMAFTGGGSETKRTRVEALVRLWRGRGIFFSAAAAFVHFFYNESGHCAMHL